MQSTETILTILVTVIGVFAFLQLVILALMFFALRKGMQAVSAHAAEVKTKIYPILDQSKDVLEHSKGILDSTKELINKLQPKIEEAVANLTDITHTASVEAKNFKHSADEINDRLRDQVARVDGMTTSALNGVVRVGGFINHAANVPAKQFSGVMAAARAVVQTLRAPAPHRAPAPPPTPFTPREERIRQERSAAVS